MRKQVQRVLEGGEGAAAQTSAQRRYGEQPLPTLTPHSFAFAPDPEPEQLPSVGYPLAPLASVEGPPRTPVSRPAPAVPSSVGPSSPGGPPGEVPAVPIIPILMYHYIRVVDPTEDPMGWRLSVAPEAFAAQLDWLDQEHYTTLRMDTVAACLNGDLRCPPRSIALTFDDGYADAATEALPLLQEHGFVATFYVVNRYIGQEGYMGWDAIRALRDAGMEIGGHTRSHLDLTALELSLASDEIAGSREQLAAELQVSVESFCYPSGRYGDATKALVAQAGYRSAVTTVPGWYQGDPYALPRIRVDGSATLEGFASLVRQYTHDP